ncbi:WD40-repeat-containing domain protein [Baffinella frigidus]|nr:WD40-repeat-containing domain protein [Cryptophyta sp. CCMP2293]
MGGSYSRIAAEKRAKEAALLAAPVPLHRHSVTCIKFCNGGDLVLTASEDRTLALWDFSQGQKFGKLWRLNKLTDPCSKPAEDAAAANGHPASVGVLRCPLPGQTHEGHSHWVTCVDIDPASSIVYSGGMDRVVKAWDMYSGRCLRTYHGHTDWVTQVSVKGRVIYSASDDGACRLWRPSHLMTGADAEHTAEVKAWDGAGNGGVRGMHVEGGHVIAAGLHGTITCWDVHVGAKVSVSAEM